MNFLVASVICKRDFKQLSCFIISGDSVDKNPIENIQYEQVWWADCDVLGENAFIVEIGNLSELSPFVWCVLRDDKDLAHFFHGYKIGATSSEGFIEAFDGGEIKAWKGSDLLDVSEVGFGLNDPDAFSTKHIKLSFFGVESHRHSGVRLSGSFLRSRWIVLIDWQLEGGQELDVHIVVVVGWDDHGLAVENVQKLPWSDMHVLFVLEVGPFEPCLVADLWYHFVHFCLPRNVVAFQWQFALQYRTADTLFSLFALIWFLLTFKITVYVLCFKLAQCSWVFFVRKILERESVRAVHRIKGRQHYRKLLSDSHVDRFVVHFFVFHRFERVQLFIQHV